MTFKKFILAVSFAVLTPGMVLAVGATDPPQTQGIGPFGGLNTSQSQEAISATQSPDLLNVDISNGGTSVKKRQGYGLDATLFFSTSPVHNLYKFFDSSGNEIRLSFNDVKVTASVNGAAWAVILTTGITSGATWDCTDYLGSAYCVSSAFDCPIKTNGTTAGTTGVCGTNLVPQGSLISNSGDRLLVGATSANPSRLYYSQSAVVTNFTLGVQPSDSSFEDIVAPGSKLTHLAYRFGRWLWWKDQSFGFIVGTGQFDLQIITVSNTIGTLDNTDVFDGNYVYFRGSDAQIYTYDGSTLSRAISTDIAPTLKTANKRKANFWSQTSQTDFQAGGSVPTGRTSSAIAPGGVTVSSYSVSEYSSAQWNLGTTNNVMVSSSSIVISTNAANLSNNSFESGQATNWTATSGWSNISAGGGACSGVTAQDGTQFEKYSALDPSVRVVVDASTSTIISSATITYTSGWVLTTLTIPTNYIRTRADLIFIDTTNSRGLISDSFVLNGASVQFYVRSCFNSPLTERYIDNVTNSPKSSITSGSFTSQTFDTTFSSAVFVQAQSNWSVNVTTPAFSVISASDSVTGPWTQITNSTGTNGSASRYLRYVSTISVSATGNALTAISSATLIVGTTGSYYSDVNNAPNLTSFSTVGMTDSGEGSISYFTRSSTSSFTIFSSTPAWVSQTKNATVSASSGTYMQLRADFLITIATQAPTLSDFTFNWFEGSASDKMYGTYFSNAILFSLSLGTSTSTNNRIFRYDLLSNVWTLYDIASNGFLTYNNNLYFGDPTAGRVFQFGNNVYSDNGTAINAYWKSKPYFGDSPFTQKDMRTASWYIAYDSGTILTMTYTIDQSTNTVSKTINLYDSRKGIIQSNLNFNAGTVATNFSAKFGDNSSNSPWEVFGGLITFVSRPWIITP